MRLVRCPWCLGVKSSRPCRHCKDTGEVSDKIYVPWVKWPWWDRAAYYLLNGVVAVIESAMHATYKVEGWLK